MGTVHHQQKRRRPSWMISLRKVSSNTGSDLCLWFLHYVWSDISQSNPAPSPVMYRVKTFIRRSKTTGNNILSRLRNDDLCVFPPVLPGIPLEAIGKAAIRPGR